MKLAGITRKIDNVGRITVPKSVRDRFEIEPNDYVGIAVDRDRIILSKYQPACTLCGGTYHVTEYKDKYLCQECLPSLKWQVR
jgi:AbrB family transcriptional regulator, transcriptional pleiotropic regulator of transition state genes